MYIIREKDILIWFSERSDGDLGSYRHGEENVMRTWKQLDWPIVMPDPRYLTQIHGATAVEVTEISSAGCAGEGDALLTKATNLPIGVFSADCLPLVIWSPTMIAAVHAGWRGTLAGIAGQVTRRLIADASADVTVIHAVLGPCIGPCCLELGDDIPALFQAAHPGYIGAFSKGTRWHLDLRALNVFQLLEAGLALDNIRHIVDCTKCQAGRYFSFRRDQGREGSMFSGIIRSPESEGEME